MKRIKAAVICALAALLATCGLGLSSARADTRRLIRDCTWEGAVQGRYSIADFRETLRRLPLDVDEYTDCRSIIEEALRRQHGASRLRDAFLRRILVTHRGGKLHFVFSLPVCRSARRGVVRFRLAALRPLRGSLEARASSQCRKLRWRRDDVPTLSLSSGFGRASVTLTGIQRRTASYRWTLAVGSLVVDRGVVIRGLRRGRHRWIEPAFF